MPTILVFSILWTRRKTTGVMKAISHKLEDFKRLFLMSEGLRCLHGFHIDDENESCLLRAEVCGDWIMNYARSRACSWGAMCKASLYYTAPCIAALELLLKAVTNNNYSTAFSRHLCIHGQPCAVFSGTSFREMSYS